MVWTGDVVLVVLALATARVGYAMTTTTTKYRRTETHCRLVIHVTN